MTYARATTIDPNPSGDTTKGAIVDKLDVDLSNIFTHLNTHEAKASDTHGRTGALVDTSSSQTMTGKTISAPTLTGAVTASGATITGGNTVNQTITTPTITAPAITGGSSTNQTITTPIITGGTIQNTVATDMTIYTPTVTGGSATNMTITTPTVTGGSTINQTITTPTITGDVACSHLTPVIGSDADGDLWYRASGIVARLAKGAADTKLFMNAGATAPEWVSGVKIGTFNRGIDGTTGNVSYTGAGFKPTALIFFSHIPTTYSQSMGLDDGTLHYSSANNWEAGAMNYSSSSAASIRFIESYTAKMQTGYVTSLDVDGFTISWTRTGTTSAFTGVVYYLAIR